jgi:hypothetical protein
MSCVTSKFIKNNRGNNSFELQSYGISNTFFLNVEQRSPYECLKRICMNLSVDEAKILRDQLEQFIRMNQIK